MIEIHLFEQLAAFADCGTLSAALSSSISPSLP